MKYLVVFEKAGKNYSAYIPDVPGCVATGKTPEETKERIKEALAFHLEGLEEDGQQKPNPIATADYVAV
ncbi:MAG: type II toxin-antitoxin system HicB family antitoxin [Candidatus Riflebacteria bacterium]|nr:type II toxin-antitoxin system HicB family antitoxin [Candidatus Riflebacteria bacterium]